MSPSNFTQRLPSRGNQDDGPSPPKQQAPMASQLPAPAPSLTSDAPNLEPTPPAVTSDIVSPANPHSAGPRVGHSAHPYTESPRSSRIEVVLNVSPYKKLSGHKPYDEADLEDDELMTTKLTPPKNRPRPSQPSSAPRHVVPVTKPSIPPATKRPRGRPKGWRPGMPSTKTGLPTASATKYLDADGKPITAHKPPVAANKPPGQKRRGRPPRPPSPTARNVWETMAPPKYVAFQCEWQGCRAELQNIQTLRKHLRVVHGGPPPLVCRWARCGKADPPPTFTQDSEFHSHVDTAHLMPYVWHCGEGQSNSRCVRKRTADQDKDEIPGYLLGPDGAQVTPWVKGQLEEDALTYRENRRRLQRILFQRDANAPSEEEDEAEEPTSP